MIRYLLSPIVLMSAVWCLSTLLYLQRWSVQFVFDASEILPVVGVVLAAFCAGCGLALVLHRVMGKRNAAGVVLEEVVNEESLEGCWRMTQRIFLGWLVLASAQMAYMRGFPLWWLIVRDGRTYTDFGIPSLNGLLNSMILACALSAIYSSLVTGHRGRLWIVFVQLAYAIMLINRQMLFTIVFEGLVLYLMHHCNRPRVLIRIVAPLVLLFIANGIIGNYRSGNDELKDTFQLRFEYSEMPGSVVWVYAYLTTPINNLINTIFTVDPTYNPVFPNTISWLFPSVLRDQVFANTQMVSAQLYASAFTVSTAVVDPYLDFGYLGIAAISALYGFLAQITWFSGTPISRLSYCVLAQCVLLSVFSNILFYLPSVFQLFWVLLIGSRARHSGIYVDSRGQAEPAPPETAPDSIAPPEPFPYPPR